VYSRKQFFHVSYFLLVLAVLLLNNTGVFAQFIRFPHPHQPVKKNFSFKQEAPSARSKEIVPKSLPFWDDFSFTSVNDTTDTLSNYPVDSLWVNNGTVWINNGMAINPPSVNVATFDGLDINFLPYSEQVLSNGLRDSLVSQAIKLGTAEVSVGERNSVYLSFFYQWQGNGEAPDAADYLQVEFRNNLGQWEEVMTIYPRASFNRTEFYDTLIKVDGDRFFHDLFQFRFQNYGRLSGPYDTWNIDYVYLNKNRNVNDIDFPDQAIASPLTGLFERYQSIPYLHFKNSNALTSPTFDVYNILNEFTDLSYLTQGTFRNYIGGILSEKFYANLGGTDTSAINDNGSGIIFPLERRTVTLEYIPDAGETEQFNPAADSVILTLKVKLFTGDTFDPKTGDFANDYDLNYVPIDFRANDTLSASYVLNDYYAYDDGVAEYAAGLTQPGNRAAVLFEMLTTDADTLVGIDIYVPDYGLSSNLTADFYVYADEDGKPGTILYAIPSFSVQRKGLNAFQRIKIPEPFLVKTKFYIGWKAPVGGVLKVGLDLSHDSQDKIFVNTNGIWVQDADVSGSLMIRPVFGSGDIVTGVEEKESEIVIYPNPSTGEFFIRGNFDDLQILNVTGLSIPFEMYESGPDQKVRLKDVASGLYILRIRQDNKIRTEKVIVK